MTTPRDIITRHIQSVPNIRLPFARLLVDRIFADLADHGYTFTEKGASHEERTGDGGSGAGKDRW